MNRSGRSAASCTESTEVYEAEGAVNRSGRSAASCTESTEVYGAVGAVNRGTGQSMRGWQQPVMQ
jgi:hypothetical protein